MPCGEKARNRSNLSVVFSEVLVPSGYLVESPYVRDWP